MDAAGGERGEIGARHKREKRDRDEAGFDSINHMLLLAMNDTGYKNLIALVSKAYLEGFYYRPRIDQELLELHHEGLIATSGCLSSMVPRDIVQGQVDSAWRRAEDMSRLFGDRYYLELQRHGIADQDLVNAELVKMSSDLKIPLVATNDAHYLEHEDHDHHDALLCIGTASNLDDAKRFRFDGQGFFLKSADEMSELFHDHPSAVSATVEIAERCDVEIPMGTYHLPEYQVPSGESLEGVLANQAWSGLRDRLGMEPDEPFDGPKKSYSERMQYELGVIDSMGFAGYFLVVADFIGYARRNGIPVGPGRGSSAGSLAAYGLGITGVDPISGTEALAYDFLAKGGKYSRPYITLAVYDALRGGHATLPNGAEIIEEFSPSVLRTAMSIETFHKASLVHDDIQDDDSYRYGDPTLHHQHGTATAINVGNIDR